MTGKHEYNDCESIRLGHYALFLSIVQGLRPEQAIAKLHGLPEPQITIKDTSDIRIIRANPYDYTDNDKPKPATEKWSSALLAEAYGLELDEFRSQLSRQRNTKYVLNWRERSDDYYEKNRERARAYYAKNKEKQKAYQRSLRAKNAKKIREKKKELIHDI